MKAIRQGKPLKKTITTNDCSRLQTSGLGEAENHAIGRNGRVNGKDNRVTTSEIPSPRNDLMKAISESKPLRKTMMSLEIKSPGKAVGEKKDLSEKGKPEEGKSEKEVIQGSVKPAVTTTIGTSLSPSKAPLKSHNKVVEALMERKPSERQSGEVGRCPGDSKKIQGLPVAHGLLFPPSEELFFGDDTNSTPAEVSDQISPCKKIGLKSIICP